MRPSFEALPSWLGRLPQIPPTPVRAYVPREPSVLERALKNPRLPLHVVTFAVMLGVGAAVAAGALRAEHRAQSDLEMTALAEGKAAELAAARSATMPRARTARAAVAGGGSLIADVPGFHDVVEGTEGRRFRRRWDIDAAPTGSQRIMVRVQPIGPRRPQPVDVTTVLPRP